MIEFMAIKKALHFDDENAGYIKLVFDSSQAQKVVETPSGVLLKVSIDEVPQ